MGACGRKTDLPSRTWPLQVCDSPHPLIIKEMIEACLQSDIDRGYARKCLAITLTRDLSPTPRDASLITACTHRNKLGHAGMQELWDMGYAPVDIITVVFRVARNFEPMAEYVKLEYIKVWRTCCEVQCPKFHG